MQLVDGKATAAAIKEQIAQEVAQIVAAGGKQPHPGGCAGGSRWWQRNLCEEQGSGMRKVRIQIYADPF